MTVAKIVVNYTPEMTADVVSKYLAGETIDAIAVFAGKSTRSIVAKLSREGVYTSKAKAKTAVRVTKDELVAQIAEHMGVDEETIDSLEKATAGTLNIVLKALQRV